MKKIILPGMAAGAVSLVLGMAVSYLFIRIPEVASDYNNANLIRPWKDPLMAAFFLQPFLQGIIFAWAWNKSKILFLGSWQKRGVLFGIALWIITSIPGMFATYTSFPLSLLTVISWSISGLASGIASGLIFVKMNQ